MARSSRQKINEDTAELNSTINQLDRMDTQWTTSSSNSNTHIFLKLTWKIH